MEQKLQMAGHRIIPVEITTQRQNEFKKKNYAVQLIGYSSSCLQKLIC